MGGAPRKLFRSSAQICPRPPPRWLGSRVIGLRNINNFTQKSPVTGQPKHLGRRGRVPRVGLEEHDKIARKKNPSLPNAQARQRGLRVRRHETMVDFELRETDFLRFGRRAKVGTSWERARPTEREYAGPTPPPHSGAELLRVKVSQVQYN